MALRAQDNGHTVKTFIRRYDRWKRPIGRGLIDRVNDWRPWIRWADLVLLEANTVYMTEIDRWRKEGVPIVGGSCESASWEIERTVGMKVLKRAGIPILPYREFDDYEAAARYVKSRGEPLVSKPCGRVDDKSLSYVPKSPDDLLFMLERWRRKHGGKPPCPFILQDKVSGTEFAIGAWFGPGGFVDGLEENFEHKKLMPGDLGPNTGELGTVLRLVRRSKLFDKVLKPLEEQLAAIGYVGNIDVNCIIDHDGGNPWPLEFTTRFGWPAFCIELALYREDFCEFLLAVATGSPTSRYRVLDEVVCGVVMAIPDFPYSHATRKEVIGLPLWTKKQKSDHHGEADDQDVAQHQVAHFHPCEMMAGDITPLASAGDYIGVATGTGSTVREAARAAYRVLEGFTMPGSPFWRVDIGQRCRRDLPRLQEHGYATGMTY